MNEKEVVEQAIKEFPDAENDLVAVDKLQQKVYSRLHKMKKGTRHDRANLTYLKLKAIYRAMRERYYFNNIGERT